MNPKNKLLGLVILSLLVSCYSAYNVFSNRSAQNFGSVKGEAPTFYSASSTAFTLTTADQRLLGTSTPTRRLGATVQPVNCTPANGSIVYMKAGADAAATAGTGIAAYGSTTFAFEEYPGVPVIQGALHGITAAGTCTVLVTEWRSQF